MKSRVAGIKREFKRRIFHRFFREFSNPLAGEDNQYLAFLNAGIDRHLAWNFEDFSARVRAYQKSVQLDEYAYRYAASCEQPTLYSSVYACATQSLLGDAQALDADQKQAWVGFLNAFQSDRDGLFRDQVVQGPLFEDSDWWGARHLAAHIIIAFTALGGLPEYPFRFLTPFYDKDRLRLYLEQHLGNFGPAIMAGDIDNQVMNYGVLLQYSRDFLNDKEAAESVALIQEWLLEKINPRTGLWGPDRFDSAAALSRAVQFAYHLFPILTYDGIGMPHREALLQQVIRTQNDLGGFGEFYNSSACEDIDSIELIYRLARQGMPLDDKLRAALNKARVWVLANQNEDGGFVFRRNEAFVYGHQQMSSGFNESHMFATWFRTLSMAYLDEMTGQGGNFRFVRCPGLQFI